MGELPTAGCALFQVTVSIERPGEEEPPTIEVPPGWLDGLMNGLMGFLSGPELRLCASFCMFSDTAIMASAMTEIITPATKPEDEEEEDDEWALLPLDASPHSSPP